MVKHENKYINDIATYLALAFFVWFPFHMVNHTLVYFTMEMFGLYGLLTIKDKNGYSDVFFKGYLFIICWCAIVTIFSPNLKLSLKCTTQWTLPILMFLGLRNFDVKIYIRKYIWISIVITLMQSIVLYIYFHYGLPGVFKNDFFGLMYYLNWEWTGKVFSSTIALCLIICALFVIENKRSRNTLIIVNIIAGSISNDRMFFFSLALMIVVYLFIRFKRLIPFSLSILIVPFGFLVLFISGYILNYIIGVNLNIMARFAVYAYWLPKLFISPIYGVGVGIPSLHYYLQKFPVPEKLLRVDVGMTSHAHNVFLDIALTQGFVGLAIFIGFLILIIVKSIRNTTNPDRFMVLYMIIAIFSKFMVDDRFDGHNMITFWFFIIISYIISCRKKKV